jgi:hypothetical protein
MPRSVVPRLVAVIIYAVSNVTVSKLRSKQIYSLYSPTRVWKILRTFRGNLLDALPVQNPESWTAIGLHNPEDTAINRATYLMETSSPNPDTTRQIRLLKIRISKVVTF